jgi:LysR family transcriptional regulator, benzoate and cis,cis-muconate-responsive activator of ben and cat genes
MACSYDGILLQQDGIGQYLVLSGAMSFGYSHRMELRHLRYFVTAAEELNISRASARLRVSQPAVSRQMRDLENELGVALFVRRSAGLALTDAGESFLAHAREILRKSAEAVAHMDSFRRRPVKKLTVGYISSVLPEILTPALRMFSRDNVDTEVSLKELAPQDQVRGLREGRIDLALLGNPCPELAGEFDIVELRRISFSAVLPDDHRFAGRSSIGLKELKSETFIGFDEALFPGRNASICCACQAAGFTPRLVLRVENLTALLANVAVGKGLALTPEDVSQLPHSGVVFVNLKRPVPSVISAAATRKNDRNPALAGLLKLCREST